MCWTTTFPGMTLNQHHGFAWLGQPGTLWGTLLTPQEGTDQNLRTTSVCKQKRGAADENKEEVHPRLWKAFHSSLASQVQDPQFQIRLKSHQTTGTAEMELKSSLKITETFRVWAGSIIKLC